MLIHAAYQPSNITTVGGRSSTGYVSSWLGNRAVNETSKLSQCPGQAELSQTGVAYKHSKLTCKWDGCLLIITDRQFGYQSVLIDS